MPRSGRPRRASEERDGYALIARIRSTAAFRELPAIAVTASATDLDRQIAMAAGFQAHIPKPFEPTRLVRGVMSLIGKTPPRA